MNKLNCPLSCLFGSKWQEQDTAVSYKPKQVHRLRWPPGKLYLKHVLVSWHAAHSIHFYRYELSTVQHWQLMMHSPEKNTMHPTSSQILQESQHSIIFFSKKYVFFCSALSALSAAAVQSTKLIHLLCSGSKTCLSWGCPLPKCHHGFSLHIPWCLALQYTELLCDTCSAAHPQPLTFCTSTLASNWTFTPWLLVRVSKQ